MPFLKDDRRIIYEVGMDRTIFTRQEFQHRVERARALMTELRLDAIMVNSEKNVEYFSGYASDLWASPTRPFYFVLPRVGEPIAVLPQGADVAWLNSSWAERMTTWPAPRPENEGVTELASEIKKVKQQFGRVGIEMGPESRIGMTLNDALQLLDALRPLEVADCSGLCRRLRIIKSDAEIARIEKACTIASDAFDKLPEMITPGSTEKQVANRFMAAMIAGGADKVPFMAMGAGPGGYETIILRPSQRTLERGDILAIDTGAEYGGYFCDFDRTLAIGTPGDEARRVYEALYRATDAGLAAARPGNKAADLYHAQVNAIEAAGVTPATMGRYGHGLGKMLTEWPSNKPDDHTILQPGMVMTIEPGIAYGNGKVMVQEENIVITDDGCRLLSRRAHVEMPVVYW